MIDQKIPRGFGLYLGRVLGVWTPSQRAAHAHRVTAARISHVCLDARAIDGFRAIDHLDAIRSAADCYREIAGVSVSIYAFPGSAAVRDVDELVDETCRLADAIRPAFVVPDAEKPYRDTRGLLRGWIEGMRARMPAQPIGVTTLGTPHGLPDFPWAECASADWLGWQEYDTAGDRRRSRAGLEQLRELMGAPERVVPHLAVYERHSATTALEGLDGARRLTADIERACLDDGGRCDVPGAWLWSDASLDPDECDALSAWASRVGWR